MALYNLYATQPRTLFQTEDDWSTYADDIHYWAQFANVHTILDGTRTRPEDPEAAAAWDSDHAALMTTLRNTMSKKMKKAYVRRGDSAADIWTRLGARFADTSRASLKFREDKYKNNLKGSSHMREWQESLDEDFDAFIDAGGVLRDEDRLEVLMDNVGPDYSRYTEAWDAGLAMGQQLTYANACQALISAELKMKRNKERHATSLRQVNSANTVSCYVCLKNHVHIDFPKKPSNVYTKQKRYHLI